MSSPDKLPEASTTISYPVPLVISLEILSKSSLVGLIECVAPYSRDLFNLYSSRSRPAIVFAPCYAANIVNDRPIPPCPKIAIVLPAMFPHCLAENNTVPECWHITHSDKFPHSGILINLSLV